jgi:hypothetical protein
MSRNLNEHIWTASGTDIEDRWVKMYGWVRPSEQAVYQEKFRYFQELPLRSLDDKARVEYENVLKRNKVVRIK